MMRLKMFTFSPLQENTYLLWNEKKEAIIIDPGCYFTAEEEALQSFVEEHQLTPVQLLNTHCHLDHVFGLKWTAKQYNLIPHMHPVAEKELSFAPSSGLSWGMPFSNYEGPVEHVNDGDTISIGDEILTVIHAPGHSPGSICFYSEKHKLIIGGDVLFFQSIGRTDLPGGNHAQLLKSIKERLFTLPDETVVYSGHGPKTTIGSEKRNNPFLREIA
ncbi:MBL fold metallo-hydrolase [Panacibacter sp. DH6]|uniref:MBL fold metallo-hydrolase n=1 Tax=Panacibacter microcysteis TaxID=2793269 RepID=A0A931E1P0_9BACT|nr:MBL fold metallo-hydrolase [Panacibacter microcysteis]MBG9375855.1 MBL fold metallo-hydrolase [Panacibacter microcysteis]